MERKRKVFKKLVSVDEAMKKLLSEVPPRPPVPEEVPLTGALGYYLAEDVRSPVNLPPYPRTSVDGYAVKARSTWGASEETPVELKVVGRVPVGVRPNVEVGEGEAAEVDTGSALPPGADAVVMVEYVKELEDDRILVFKSVVPGENVLWPATDVHREELLFKKGTRIDSRVIAALAAVGINKVRVWKPKVYVISTGNELVEPGRPLEPGKIYDINTYSLSARLNEEGFVPIVHGVVPDDEEEIERAILKGVEVADVVITTGSTSAGPEDKVYRVVGRIGRVLVHGLAFKPGKPVMLGVVEGKPVFGLAGHPDSAYFNLERIVIPYLKMMVGATSLASRTTKAVAASQFVGAKGRRTHVPVVLLKGEGWHAFPASLSDHAMVSYSRADGYIVIPEDRRVPIKVGEVVEVTLFREPSYDYAFVGDTDVPVDDALAEFGKTVKFLYLGSFAGEYASKNRLKAVWLSPEASGVEIEEEVVVVGKGNTVGIPHKASFLYKPFLKWLKTLGLSRSELERKGVVVVIPTPQGLASAVKEGLVECAITTRRAAERFGLDWKPLDVVKLRLGWHESQKELGDAILERLRSRS